MAMCLLAKDEGKNVGAALSQIAKQTFVSRSNDRIDLHVVANGCTDDTVEVAQRAKPLFNGTNVRLQVHDLQQGGKSRAWNKAVHELIDPEVDVILFIDADIKFVDEEVITAISTALRGDANPVVCVGYPVKDISIKARKSALDRFSLLVSERSRHVGAVCGQLYAIEAATAREIWLPDETPGEDGFLNAMVSTGGFSMPAEGGRISQLNRPTHYYEALRPLQFVGHERRLIVATVINRWIFEHLWSLKLKSPAGPLIAEWNVSDPDWVERLIRRKAAEGRWLIPKAILLGRFMNLKARSVWKDPVYLPLAVAATVLTLPPAIAANRRLKRAGAASTW